jgi:penicillin-binding protein 1A
LGNRETGGRAALPMWIRYMKTALKGRPLASSEQPPGLVTVRIDPDTGLLANAGNPDAIFETFRVENVPKEADMEATVPVTSGSGQSAPAVNEGVPEELF